MLKTSSDSPQNSIDKNCRGIQSKREREQRREIQTQASGNDYSSKLMGDFNKETRAYSYTLMAQAPESHLQPQLPINTSQTHIVQLSRQQCAYMYIRKQARIHSAKPEIACCCCPRSANHSDFDCDHFNSLRHLRSLKSNSKELDPYIDNLAFYDHPCYDPQSYSSKSMQVTV